MEKATYVSVWDDGITITTNCFFDRSKNMVSEIETSDVEGLNMVEDEYVLLSDGTEIRDFITDYDDDLFSNNFI